MIAGNDHDAGRGAIYEFTYLLDPRSSVRELFRLPTKCDVARDDYSIKLRKTGGPNNPEVALKFISQISINVVDITHSPFTKVDV
jgi:hypothetical protein